MRSLHGTIAAAMLLLGGSCALGAASLEPPFAVQTWSVDEGTLGVLVEDHRTPLVTVRLEFPVGVWSPWARRSHAEEAFEIGLHDSAGALRARADALAAGLSLGMGVREARLAASCLEEDLPAVLELVRDVLDNRDLDRRELKRWRKESEISWESSQKDPSFRGNQAEARALFERDDPRRIPWEKPDRVETRTERLVMARDAIVRLPGRVIAFAGDLTREEAERAATGLLPRPAPLSPEDLGPVFRKVTSAGSRVHEVAERITRLTQVYFSLGRDSLPLGSPDYPAFVIADHVLGGHFYSRLTVALRHEGGETYGAGTSDYEDVVTGPYSLFTFTRRENAAATEAKLREALRLFHERGITEEERSDAIGSLRGRRLFDRQAAAQILGRFLWERRMGLPRGFSDEVVERASRLTLEEINRFIGRFYDPREFFLIRVEPPPGP